MTRRPPLLAQAAAAACAHPAPPAPRPPAAPRAAPPPAAPVASPSAPRPAALPALPALPARPATQTCLAGGAFPERLSETGCYADLRAQRPGPDLVPYEVNAPLWSDGARKRRWLVIPPGQTIAVAADGRFELPVGAVLVKEFRLTLAGPATADPPLDRPIETRLMLRTPQGWQFRAYRWNDEGTDARRLEETRRERFTIVVAGRPQPLAYAIPAPHECRYCHGAPAEVLGPSSAQLDRTLLLGGRPANQLDALAALGLFAPGSRLHLPAAAVLADPEDPAAPLERRARSYLHAQCAHCHQPGGWVPPGMTMDLRFDRPLGDARICGVDTQFFVVRPRVAPGHPRGSVVWRRLSAVGLDRMPPLGTTLVDPAAAVVRDWIAALPSCPPPAP